MPAGLETTVPLPLVETLSTAFVPAVGAKPACTERAWLIFTTQLLAAPVQAPDQPVKLCPAPGVAVSVTLEFAAKEALHAAAEQLMPEGCEPTVPVPLTETLSV